MACVEVRGGRQTLGGAGIGKGRNRGAEVVAYAMVPDDVVEVVNRYSWYLTNWGYPATRTGGPALLMHRLVYLTLYGFLPGPGEDLDHIDRNRLNCLEGNLRRVSRSFNNANMGKNSKNTSGYRGVSWDTERRRWSAKIQKDGRTINLGRHGSAEAAAQAVNAAFRDLFPGVTLPNPEL